MPTTVDIESQRMFLGSTPVRKIYQGTNLLGMRIAELFANGEQGVWYDPSDFNTMFQDAAGTTPVTAVEQPVGLMLDKSGNGNHASQPTATSRPVLSARVNLLTKTEQFDDAVWGKTGATIVPNAAIAPDGTLSADAIVEDTSNGFHGPQENATGEGRRIVVSVYAKKGSREWLYLRTGSTSWSAVFFNLATGTVGSVVGNVALDSYGMEPAPNGFYRCWVVRSAAQTPAMRIYASSGDNLVNGYTGDGTSGIYIWGADLRVANDGANLPPYQRVNTATDYDTVGFPHYLRFDGVDDWLVTPTITPGTDKVQLFAGVRKLSDPTSGIICELSDNSTVNNGSAALLWNATGMWTVLSKGTTFRVGAEFPEAGPLTRVLTGLCDIPGDSAILRANGTQVASNTTDQGTGNYLTYPLYIGRRGGTSLPFNGHLYSLIVRFGSNLPIAMIEKTEKYINQKTRAY